MSIPSRYCRNSSFIYFFFQTENVIEEVQGGFRRGRGYTDQIFIVRQICEKYLGKGKDVYFAFLDLEKHMIELIEMQCGMFEIIWNWW